MSQVDEVYVKQYGANVYQLAQQKGSILRPYVKTVEMRGEKRTFERVKPTTAVRSTSKYMPTPLIETEFDRRTMHASEWIWADIMDWQDDLNILIDPKASIVEAGAMALGRTIDDIIIGNGFDGVAYEGKEGLTQVAFPSAQKVAITEGGTSGSNEGLNVDKLILTRSMFGQNDIDIDSSENEMFICVTQRQMDDLARKTDIKSRDYNSILDLYEGKTKKFLGFTFIRCERLPRTSLSGGGYSRMNCAWCRSGIVLAMPKEIGMTIDKRPDISNNWQALGKMKCGCTRVEDKKVIQLFNYEAN